MKNVLIIIINYRRSEDTLKCLNSVLASSYKDYKIILIDNASKDDSVEKILKWINKNDSVLSQNEKTHFSDQKIVNSIFSGNKIEFILSKENYGFAGANNIGMSYAIENGYDYVLLLNNDTIVKADFIEPFIELAESDSSIGIVGGKALSPKNNSVISAGGKMNWLRGFGNNMIENEKWDLACEVEFVSGCQMLIKKEVLETVGYLSEQYFLYYEDVDYCFRSREKGWKVYYEPKSIIWHNESTSTGYGSPSRYFYLTRARIIFNKIYNKKYFIIFTIYLSILQVYRIIKWFFSGKIEHVKAAILSQLAFFKRIN